MARETVENMTALPDFEVEEILLKIQELENIVKSDERKLRNGKTQSRLLNGLQIKELTLERCFSH